MCAPRAAGSHVISQQTACPLRIPTHTSTPAWAFFPNVSASGSTLPVGTDRYLCARPVPSEGWRRECLSSSGSSLREMRCSNFLSARSSLCPQGSRLFLQTADRKGTCVHRLHAPGHGHVLAAFTELSVRKALVSPERARMRTEDWLKSMRDAFGVITPLAALTCRTQQDSAPKGVPFRSRAHDHRLS
jgi:hypothetical protein